MSAVLSSAVLVGVAIALAVAVFFFATILSKSPRDAPPNVARSYDENEDEMQFVRSTNTYDLSTLEVGMSVDGHYAYNAPVDALSPSIGPAGRAALSAVPGTEFAPGDVLRFCADAPASQVVVSVVHPASDTLLLRHTYSSIRACA